MHRESQQFMSSALGLTWMSIQTGRQQPWLWKTGLGSANRRSLASVDITGRRDALSWKLLYCLFHDIHSIHKIFNKSVTVWFKEQCLAAGWACCDIFRKTLISRVYGKYNNLAQTICKLVFFTKQKSPVIYGIYLLNYVHAGGDTLKINSLSLFYPG